MKLKSRLPYPVAWLMLGPLVNLVLVFAGLYSLSSKLVVAEPPAPSEVLQSMSELRLVYIGTDGYLLADDKTVLSEKNLLKHLRKKSGRDLVVLAEEAVSSPRTERILRKLKEQGYRVVFDQVESVP